MTLSVNGFDFADARVIEPKTSWGERRYSLHNRKPHVSRNSVQSHPIGIAFTLKGTNAFKDKELLQGLMQQGQVVALKSTTQKLWGNSLEALATCLALDFVEEGPTYWLGNASLEFIGLPSQQYVAFDVSTIQEKNDYALAGRTTVGIPAGTPGVVDPGDGTNFSTSFIERENVDIVLTGYDALDTGVYVINEVKQTSLSFLYSTTSGHTNAVKVFDGADKVTNVDHKFVGAFKLENGMFKVVSGTNLFELRFNDNALLERFTTSLDIDTANVYLLALSSEYAALIIDNQLIIELFRGRDLTITVLAGVLKYLDAAGASQFSVPSNNALAVGTLFVSSNAFFKTTVDKEIARQGGADPNPAVITTPRFQIIKDDGDVATRKLEVLKRQA